MCRVNWWSISGQTSSISRTTHVRARYSSGSSSRRERRKRQAFSITRSIARKLETRTGNLTRAYTLELECLQIVEPLDNHVPLAASLAWLGLIEAMLGRAESTEHSERALAIAEARKDAYNAVRARGALGLAALSHADAGLAVDWLEPAATIAATGGVGNPNFFRLEADLIEALARLGRPAHAAPHLARLETQAESTGRCLGPSGVGPLPWDSVRAARGNCCIREGPAAA